MSKLGKPNSRPGGTVSGPHPSKFPIGSAESRAAAMSLARGHFQPPRVMPVFVTKQSVLEKREHDYCRATYGTDVEFLRAPTETAEQFSERVLNSVPVGGRELLAFFVK